MSKKEIKETVISKKYDIDNNYLTKNSEIDSKPNQIQTSEMSATANERDPSTEMVLKATGNSWVEIEDLDGNVLMTRLMRPGETYVVPNIIGQHLIPGMLALCHFPKAIKSFQNLGNR